MAGVAAIRAVNTDSPDRPEAADWDGPGAPARSRRGIDAPTLLWALVFPVRRHRIGLTLPGFFLMLLAMGIGSAAYNTASNILFITLSLLLACLLLSGLLSWFNFRGVCWRLVTHGRWRAGHEALVTVEIRNRKRWLPTYSLGVELTARPKLAPAAEKSVREPTVREALAEAEKLVTRGRLWVRERIEAGGSAGFEWPVKPERRGEALVELVAVGSLFPFGFLRKSIGIAMKRTVLVWPAQTAYRWTGAAAMRSGSQGRRTARIGRGDDLLALRDYAPGDSHRSIHWKASARLGHLMVRQFAAESHEGYVMCLDTAADRWLHPEQFELLCSFAATMAEDLFAGARLRGLSVNGGPLLETRRLRDLEAVLDELARLQPVDFTTAGFSPRVARHGREPTLITFAPEGARGAAAYVDGRQIASA